MTVLHLKLCVHVLYRTCVLEVSLLIPHGLRHSCLSQACCLHFSKQIAVLGDDSSREFMSNIVFPAWHILDPGNEKKES